MTDEMDVTNEAAQTEAASPGRQETTHVSIPKRWLIVGGSALIAVLLLAGAFAGGVAVGSRAGHAPGRGDRAIDGAFPNGDVGQGQLGDPHQSRPGPDGDRGLGGPQGRQGLPEQPDTQHDQQQDQGSSNQS